MRRRDFIRAIGGAAAGWPLSALAQQERGVRRIGVLFGGSADDSETQARFAILRQSLQDLGWSDSRNIRIDYRVTRDVSRMREYASELVRLGPDVIVTHPTPATSAIKKENTQVPVVFVAVSDPIGSGFVTSFARPGGSMTGFTNFETTLGGKWLDVLKEIVPGLTRAGFLYNPDTAAAGATGGVYLESAKGAAARLGVELIVSPVRDVADIEFTISSLAKAPGGCLIVNPNVFTRAHRATIAASAAKHRVPTIYPYAAFVEAGGLLSYGIEPRDLFRHAAVYVDRILKGVKPADLPVQAPTKLELIVNLKAAKALGLTIPESFLLRADKVIE
jgi:putative tryptophan/tyrosine transport system substrate-binding protein